MFQPTIEQKPPLRSRGRCGQACRGVEFRFGLLIASQMTIGLPQEEVKVRFAWIKTGCRFQMLLGIREITLLHVQLPQLLLNAWLAWRNGRGTEQQGQSLGGISAMNEHNRKVQQRLFARMIGWTRVLQGNRAAVGSHGFIRSVQPFKSQA
jgi:hypothetical protein